MQKTSASATDTLATKPASALASVAVVGLGYVGLPLAILADEKRLEVRGYDIDEHKITELAQRSAPFLSEEESKHFRASRICTSADEDILNGADVYVVCVPTPVHENHEPDLRPLLSASRTVGRHVSRGALVIIESTVNPGACESISLASIERESGLKGGTDFFFAHCPERINPGDTKWNVRTIPRVIGADDPESLARAVRFYESILDAPITPMGSIKEAEAVKMVENSFRDVNIAFVNELAMSFSKAGIDVTRVLAGAATKPFGFMPHYPGCGVGGHCIPVDPYYLIRYGRENGFVHRFLETARDINNGMPSYAVDLAEQAIVASRGTMAGAVVTLLGLAYKRDVPDLRESPALKIRDDLLARGALVRIYDPLVPGGSTHATLKDALTGADAAVIATDHGVFRALSPEDFSVAGVGIVIDGRNCLPKKAFIDAGFTYRGIGR